MNCFKLHFSYVRRILVQFPVIPGMVALPLSPLFARTKGYRLIKGDVIRVLANLYRRSDSLRTPTQIDTFYLIRTCVSLSEHTH